MSKEIRSRGWCFTWNNWTPENRLTMENVACTYIVFGEEKAPTTGTAHLQGYVYFANARTLTSMKKIHTSISWRAAKGNAEQNFEYCSKDGLNVYERGVRPVSSKEKGEAEKDRWADIMRNTKSGDVDALHEQYPKESIIYCKQLEHIAAGVKRKFDDLDDRCADWIYAPSGYGKSEYVRDAYAELGDFHHKEMTPYWQDFHDEPVVIIDDLDPPTCVKLSYHLKIWLDKFPFSAQIKNGGKLIRPKKVVVTSQYLPKDCFRDPKVVAAIERRVNIIRLKHWIEREREQPWWVDGLDEPEFTSDAACESYYGLAVRPTPNPPAKIEEDVAEGDNVAEGDVEDETFGDVM